MFGGSLFFINRHYESKTISFLFVDVRFDVGSGG